MDGTVLREVRLFGHLADGIGDTIRLAFDTPTRALRLLEVNFPGFMQRFRDGHYFVTAVRADGKERDLTPEQLSSGFTGDLIIMPAAFGAASGKKKGLLGAILGAVLVGAAFFFSGGTMSLALPGLLGSTGATFGTVAQMGVSLIMSGIATMLTPTPNTDYSDTDEKRSFIFNGATNLADQGGVVPVIFGRMMVGTTTVSASLDNELISASGTTQKALQSRHYIRKLGDRVHLFYGDLAADEQMVFLTSIDGVTVNSTGTLNLTARNLVIEYDVSGEGTGGIPGFTVIPTAGIFSSLISGFSRPAMRITATSGVNPEDVDTTQVIPFTFMHNTQEYSGVFIIDIGFPKTSKHQLNLLIEAAGGTDASGNFNA